MLCDRMGYMSVVFGVCESDWTRATCARRRCPHARACLVEWKKSQSFGSSQVDMYDVETVTTAVMTSGNMEGNNGVGY